MRIICESILPVKGILKVIKPKWRGLFLRKWVCPKIWGKLAERGEGGCYRIYVQGIYCLGLQVSYCSGPVMRGENRKAGSERRQTGMAGNVWVVVFR
jgi:hypothetical protein